jgi:hypothetical protein
MLGFSEGLKSNIAALDKTMLSIGAAFDKVASIKFIVTAMNNAGGEAVTSLSKTLTTVYNTAKPIINPNFC